MTENPNEILIKMFEDDTKFSDRIFFKVKLLPNAEQRHRVEMFLEAYRTCFNLTTLFCNWEVRHGRDVPGLRELAHLILPRSGHLEKTFKEIIPRHLLYANILNELWASEALRSAAQRLEIIEWENYGDFAQFFSKALWGKDVQVIFDSDGP